MFHFGRRVLSAAPRNVIVIVALCSDITLPKQSRQSRQSLLGLRPLAMHRQKGHVWKRPLTFPKTLPRPERSPWIRTRLHCVKVKAAKGRSRKIESEEAPDQGDALHISTYQKNKNQQFFFSKTPPAPPQLLTTLKQRLKTARGLKDVFSL